jgi:hypothetical protein
MIDEPGGLTILHLEMQRENLCMDCLVWSASLSKISAICNIRTEGLILKAACFWIALLLVCGCIGFAPSTRTTGVARCCCSKSIQPWHMTIKSKRSAIGIVVDKIVVLDKILS